MVNDKFWSKVDIRGDDECWPWTGAIGTQGYGIFYQGKQLYAHRVANELSLGSIPRGLIILHRCDNRVCCNPAHHIRGTRRDNALDRDEKSRVRHGEDHAFARLSANDVVTIKSRASAGEKRIVIATDYGLHRNYVDQVIRGDRRKRG